MDDDAARLAEHERLVTGLLASPDLPGGAPIRLETHISTLLLVGEHAWKLRKPLRLPFLDFSTADLRRRDCEEELRLNRRTAADLYLGVRPVFGPPEAPRVGAPDEAGEPVDWLLAMRRFDPATTLDGLARRGVLGAPIVDALAQRVAAFHAALPPSPPAFGRFEAVRRAALDNLDALDARGCDVTRLRGWTEAALARHAGLIETRRAAGRVREGHGDLHLGNIVLWQGEPLPFDALEFNADLRHVDVVADIAFTFMDLLRHDLRGLAWRFASGWAEHTGDHDGLALLHLHAVYRALVRAKVAALRAQQGDGAEAADALARDLALAEALAFGVHAAAAPPWLVLMHGLSGSGKSGVALRVVERLGAIRLRSDVERKRLAGLRPTERVQGADLERLYAGESTRRTFAHLAQRAQTLLRAGLHVVVDAAFLRRAERDAFAATALACGARCRMLGCSADVAVLRERVARRAADDADASDATLAVLERQLGFAEPLGPDEPALEVPTDRGDAVLDASLEAAFAETTIAAQGGPR